MAQALSPRSPFQNTETTVTATATSPFVNTATATHDDAELTPKDLSQNRPENLRSDAASLTDGTAPFDGGNPISSTLQIDTGDGDVTEPTIGDTTITVSDLSAGGKMPTGPSSTTNGAIAIAGYNPATGKVSHGYVLDCSPLAQMNTGGAEVERDVLRESVAILVGGGDGGSRDATRDGGDFDIHLTFRNDLPTS